MACGGPFIWVSNDSRKSDDSLREETLQPYRRFTYITIWLSCGGKTWAFGYRAFKGFVATITALKLRQAIAIHNCRIRPYGYSYFVNLEPQPN